MRRPSPTLAALLALAAATYLLAFRWDWLLAVDLDAIVDPRTGDLRTIPSAVSVLSPAWLGAGASLALLAGALLVQALAVGGRPCAARAIGAFAGCCFSGELAKWILGALQPLAEASHHATSASFPSVHSAVAMLLAVGILRLSPNRVTRLAVCYPAAMGILTVVVGWHYPTDVAGGWVLGAAWALAIPRIEGRSMARAAAVALAAALGMLLLLLAGYADYLGRSAFVLDAFGAGSLVLTLTLAAVGLAAAVAQMGANPRLSSGVWAQARR